jgi:hypothetical protein
VHASDSYRVCARLSESHGGIEGPQGIPGFSDCATEEFPGTNQANTFAVLNTTCSARKKAVGAGAIWHTPFDAADNGPFYFFPLLPAQRNDLDDHSVESHRQRRGLPRLPAVLQLIAS